MPQPRRAAGDGDQRPADPAAVRGRGDRRPACRRSGCTSCSTCSRCRTSAAPTMRSPTAPGAPAAGEPAPLALFTAERVDYSLQRLHHYTGTSPEHFQRFVLLTNYQRYVEHFVAFAPRGDREGTSYDRFVEPGDVVTPQPAPAAGPEPARRRPPAADAGLPPDAARRPRRHAWSISASGPATPAPSPTTSRCCGRIAG